MAEEIDDNGFYVEDFSIESDWEVFNAQLKEIFEKWELSNTDWGGHLQQGALFQCKWQIQTNTLELLKKEIAVNYYAAEVGDEINKSVSCDEKSPLHIDLMSLLNTFGPPLLNGHKSELHPLARMYGLRRFVVLHPLQIQTQFLTNPAEFSFFLSAATVVASECGATVPIFVQVYDPKWNFFIGVGVGAASLRTNFDLIALEQSPSESRYLSGLLSMFKEKVPTSYLRPATVSVRNIYALDTIRLRIPMRIPFAKGLTPDEEDGINSDIISTSNFTALPHGYFPDSSTEVYAIYTWPNIAENIAFDSALRSDFVPSKAPCGSICQSVHSTSYLSSCLGDFQKLSKTTQSVESFVGRSFSNYTGRAAQQNTVRKIAGPMNESELDQMLLYLFPDMHSDTSLFPYATKQFPHEVDPHRIKSALPDSLVLRVSSLLATCNGHFGGKNGFAQLWAAFTRGLRSLWETSIPIPGVAAGFPNTRTCLLHQKLQMLNVCIERSLCRDEPTTTAAAMSSKIRPHSDDDDDEDEFYDCTTYEDTATDERSDGDIEPEAAQAKISISPNKLEGRLKRFGDKKLLDRDEPLFVPITQEPVPKTEDQLHEDAEVMLKLGPGSALTTQMMCSSLHSDMQSFKAANPKARMEDFIRWYSPNDWIESINDDGTVEGRLSGRMLAPDNTWQTMWTEARPVPACHQKRLFDDTSEALKVLQYLETRTIGEIYALCVVPMLHSAILKLKDIFEDSNVLDLFKDSVDGALSDLCRLSHDIEIMGETETGSYIQVPKMDGILKRIETLEEHFYQYKCYEKISGYPHCSNVNDMKRQFRKLLENNGTCSIIEKNDAKREGGDGLLNPKFKNEMHDNLISKDYVIRVDGETTPSAKGAMGPQFLRAVVTGEKIRLCGAFTENTTFV